MPVMATSASANVQSQLIASLSASGCTHWHGRSANAAKGTSRSLTVTRTVTLHWQLRGSRAMTA